MSVFDPCIHTSLESLKYDVIPSNTFKRSFSINQALHLTNVRTLSAAEQLVEIAKDGVIDKLGRGLENHVFDRAHYETVPDYVMPVTVETTTDELLNITQEDVAELRQREVA
ncbi:hypothetical protein AO1008_00208 [Aspergillus oryzae 100-8]|uniref:Uncharacterized protein n=1 Tax=Aspergillus oryzae (strain 3.042) TaxID=1160506 RepID=I8TW24_ASPO3|nr:hypothetical protein Ao3042_04899 [Aspergillus oryzae 3.042]KDE84897.1 hypothetical protein AO1008_00208 [Aspergillus oryzae 100-8]|eukprot:EIT78610.1 hypothetical protein Ao3042_04899 [Aspergillus oryzae 3.042]